VGLLIFLENKNRPLQLYFEGTMNLVKDIIWLYVCNNIDYKTWNHMFRSLGPSCKSNMTGVGTLLIFDKSDSKG